MHPRGLMVRDARRCRAPHHEGLEYLILRSIAKRCVSKDEATSHLTARHVPTGIRRQRASATAVLARTHDHFIGHLSWKLSWLSLTIVATVFSESWPSASLTTSWR